METAWQVEMSLGDCVAALGHLQMSHRELAESHKELQESHKELRASHEELLESHKHLQASRKELQELALGLELDERVTALEAKLEARSLSSGAATGVSSVEAANLFPEFDDSNSNDEASSLPINLLTLIILFFKEP